MATGPTDAGGLHMTGRPPIGIVIPAHDEEATIGGCLHALLSQTRLDDRVVVICNGCSDGTATVARAFGQGVLVAEIAVASKIAALNHGDALLDLHPRLYLDADVCLGDGAVDALAEALSTGDVELAAPALAIDASAASMPVRQYLRIWSRLPSVRDDTVGRGAYALSEAGRRRFGEFPAVQADDHFVRDVVPPHRRAVLTDVTSTVQASASLRGLVRRKVRTVTGNRQLDRGDTLARLRAQARRRQWMTVVTRDPSLLPAVPVYLAVSALPRIVWAARRLRGHDGGWGRDDTTRRALPEARGVS